MKVGKKNLLLLKQNFCAYNSIITHTLTRSRCLDFCCLFIYFSVAPPASVSSSKEKVEAIDWINNCNRLYEQKPTQECCEVKHLHQPSSSFLFLHFFTLLFISRTSIPFISVDLLVPANMPSHTFTEVFPPSDVCPTLHVAPPLTASL